VNDIYGKPVLTLDTVILVSSEEAERLRKRADRLQLKCNCPSCNPPKEK
jgi:hypothetical protein